MSNGGHCKLTFIIGKEASTFMMRKGSSITARIVIFNSPTTELIIDETSKIDVSGKSFSRKGTHSGQGASFIGQGGKCGGEIIDKHYSHYYFQPLSDVNDMRNDQLMGSRGDINDNISDGGGHIHLNVDSVKLQGDGYQI